MEKIKVALSPGQIFNRDIEDLEEVLSEPTEATIRAMGELKAIWWCWVGEDGAEPRPNGEEGIRPCGVTGVSSVFHGSQLHRVAAAIAFLGD